ncbi:MAG: fumarylacetoacetate hydrolase family protein [Bryobacteraceae bacterium]|nr:fumarylacetoacetate hydrolase family protein [Bryobacteraceae bacterium]
MRTTRRAVLSALAAPAALAQSPVERFVRFRIAPTSRPLWGRLDGDTIRELSQAPYLAARETGKKHALAKVKLAAPVDPLKLLAVGLNYRSHVGSRAIPKEPEIFYKPITCLQDPGGPIVHPRDAKNLHYEGELVIVLGQLGQGGRNLTRKQAKAAIFGVTCGNDVSERDWQNGPQKDLQWWRAKGTDTFGPVGPHLVKGLDYGNLLLQTRLNGEVVQKQTTADLIFDGPTMVSYISQYVTLTAGDVIFTGTPGSTKPMKPGDHVEVELAGVGVLRNPIQAA